MSLLPARAGNNWKLILRDQVWPNFWDEYNLHT